MLAVGGQPARWANASAGTSLRPPWSPGFVQTKADVVIAVQYIQGVHALKMDVDQRILCAVSPWVCIESLIIQLRYDPTSSRVSVPIQHPHVPMATDERYLRRRQAFLE